MEATAKHEFNATSDEELSFSKRANIKIINTEEDKNWYFAEFEGRTGYIPSNYIDLNYPSWFLGSITRDQAIKLLEERNSKGQNTQEIGSFLVRHREQNLKEFSISVKCFDKIEHYLINRDNDRYSVWTRTFNSLNDLIRHYRSNSISETHNILLKDLNRTKVMANYNYLPQVNDELEINRGDIIMIINKSDPNWWFGEIVRKNQVYRGLFPKTYVSKITD